MQLSSIVFVRTSLESVLVGDFSRRRRIVAGRLDAADGQRADDEERNRPRLRLHADGKHVAEMRRNTTRNELE